MRPSVKREVVGSSPTVPANLLTFVILILYMIKLRNLLLESDYDAASDFFERRNNSLCYIANSFKHDNGKGRLKWKKKTRFNNENFRLSIYFFKS